MADPTGELREGTLRLVFGARLGSQFSSAAITSGNTALWERGHMLIAATLGFASLLLLLSIPPTLAQTPLATSPVPQGSPIPRILPPSAPTVAPGSLPLPPPASPNREIPNVSVTVTSVAIDGVTAYSLADVMKFVDGIAGRTVPLRTIDAARLAILQLYRADGYVFTAVSAHLDTEGHLRFVVTEGHIASVKLDGDIGPAAQQVLGFLTRLTEEPVIDAATLERYLLLAQDVPGVTLHAVLEPSADAPGALILIAKVTRREISGLATIDNRAFDEVGPIEAVGVIDFNSFTRYGEQTEISYYHAFPNSEKFALASTELFIGTSGLKLRAYGGGGPTDPTGNLGDIGYHATNAVFGLVASYPVIRARQQTLKVSTSFDGLNSDVTTALGRISAKLNADAVRAWRLGEEYDMSDILMGANRAATNRLVVRFSQGVPVFGAATNGASPTAARFNEDARFSKIDFEASRTQTVFAPWRDASVALFALLTGQWTTNILPPSEQFPLGGARFTRGYYAGQVLGDKALAATAELRLNTDPATSLFGTTLGFSNQFYVFYDWGQTWQNQASDFATSIDAIGGGVRSQISPNLEVDFEALTRFNRFPTGAGNGVSPLPKSAFYWRVLTRF